MKTVLEIIKLSKTFNNKEAVKNISFKVSEIIGILGQMVVGKLPLLV